MAAAPLTGLRLGELRGLRWENVDLWDAPDGDTAGMIHVTEQIDSATRTTEWTDPKSDSGVRDVPVTVDLAQALRAHRERQEKHALRRGSWRWPAHDLVFPSKNGLAIAQTSVIEARRRIADLAGLDPVPTMNCLRHTYATTLVESGMQPAQVSKLMGHADVAITIKFYFDPGPATHDSAAAAIAASYSWKDRRRRT